MMLDMRLLGAVSPTTITFEKMQMKPMLHRKMELFEYNTFFGDGIAIMIRSGTAS